RPTLPEAFEVPQARRGATRRASSPLRIAAAPARGRARPVANHVPRTAERRRRVRRAPRGARVTCAKFSRPCTTDEAPAARTYQLLTRCQSRGRSCGSVGLERGHHLGAPALEGGSLRGRHRVTAPVAQRRAGVALNSVHEDLEMEVWSSCQAGHADVRNGLPDRHVGARVNAGSEPTQVSVARNEAVAMPNLEHVAVSISPAGAHNRAVANRADRRSRRRRVIRSLVLLPDAENWMEATAKRAGDPSKFERRA